MASDSKLNTFSRRFFNFAWLKLNILSPADVTEYYGSECLTETNLEEISDLHLLQAPLTVRYFYGYIFLKSINNDKTKYQKSREEFCSYIRLMCNSENWFGKPTIFERCFATISFVLICSEYPEEEFSDIKRYAHISWIEYFNEYTEEFYNEGGWTELRRVANSYARVHDLIRIVNPAPHSLDFLIKSSKYVENYVYFCLIREDIPETKNKSKIFEKLTIEYGNKCKTSSSSWIKFIVQNSNSQSFDFSCTQAPKNPSEVAYLLRVLRNLCDPYGLRVSNSKSNSEPGLPQKSNDPAIHSPGKITESCTTKKKNYREGEPHDSHKNSNFSEATRQESSIIKSVPLQTTAVEKERKGSGNEKFTGDENYGTNNAPCTSSMAGEKLKKSKRRKRNRKKAGLQVFDKSLELGEATRPASTNSMINNFPLQNTAVEKERKDSGNENFTGRENDGTDNVPCTSSMAGGKLKKSKRRKRNRKKAGLQVFNKNLEYGEATRQASTNSTINNFPLQNTAVEKERKDSGTENFTGGENDGTDKVPYTSSMAGEELKKSKRLKRNRKKAGLQVFDKNLELGEATRQSSSNSTFNNIPLQNTAVKKERKDEGNAILTGENEGMGKVRNICLMN